MPRPPLLALKAEYLDADPVIFREGETHRDRERVVLWFEMDDRTWLLAIPTDDVKRLLARLPECLVTIKDCDTRDYEHDEDEYFGG